jgi:hypothetical protein
MKCMLMICDDESVILSPAEVHALPQIQAWDAEVDARGIRRGGARLRPSSDAATVSPKSQLGGYACGLSVTPIRVAGLIGLEACPEHCGR